MALPPQVQAALDAAEATLAAGNPAPTMGEADATQANPFEPVVASPPPVEVMLEPAPAPAPAKQEDPAWEARYKSLQGLFNKEVPALQQQVKVLEGNLHEAVARLDRASTEKEQVPQKSLQADARDVESYGEDMVAMVSRVAQGVITQAAQALEARASALETKVAQLSDAMQGATQAVALTAEQAFFERVDKLAPEWETINGSQAFLAWLAEADPVYGIPRQLALDDARTALDAVRVASVFNAFAPTAPVPAPAPDLLDAQISPRSVASPAPAATDKTVITQAQITAFYDDVRKGAYRGNEVEGIRLEGIINTALAEGRVR